jgi:hypothetical protein
MSKINYKNLQSLDIVCCGGKGLIAGVIRLATGNRLFDKRVSTHTGMVFDVHGQKMIAEATPKGLKLNSLEEYYKSSRRFIVGVFRSESVPLDMKICAEKAVAVDLRKTIEYDYTGDLSFVIKRVGHDEDKVFCSEYVQQIYSKYLRYAFQRSRNGLSSPQDIYDDCKRNFTLVEWENK